jgi:L-cysteine desulfidase
VVPEGYQTTFKNDPIVMSVDNIFDDVSELNAESLRSIFQKMQIQRSFGQALDKGQYGIRLNENLVAKFLTEA